MSFPAVLSKFDVILIRIEEKMIVTALKLRDYGVPHELINITACSSRRCWKVLARVLKLENARPALWENSFFLFSAAAEFGSFVPAV